MPSDPWRHVDADEDLVADLLAGTVDAVLERGGWLHPEARIVARDGQLRLDCPAPDGEPLIRLPREAFIPIGRVQWGTGTESLDIEGLHAEVDDLELLLLQTALHNACGKLPWLAHAHPVLAPDLDDAPIAAARSLRPSSRSVQPTAAELLWSTRAFRLPVDRPSPEPFALPIVDCLNHHHRGATGTWSGGHFSVDIAHPDGSDECLLDYGLMRDAIGMAVVYGFAAEAPIAHSAPFTIELEGIGRMTVDARGRSAAGALLPVVVMGESAGVRVSHLPIGRHGGVAERIAQTAGCSVEVAEHALEEIAAANAVLADALEEAAGTTGGPAAGVLVEAARCQRRACAQIRAAGDPITASSVDAPQLGEDDIDAVAGPARVVI